MKTRVRDVMTSPVETVEPTTGFREVATRLREKAISAVPVVDAAGRVLGVVSEADLLLKEERASLEAGRHLLERARSRTTRAKAAGATAAELMTSPAVTISPDVWVAFAARMMHRHGVRRLPVVDDVGRLVGIVSRRDLLRVFARTDEEIRLEIVHGVIEQTLLVDSTPITVAVDDGLVSLGGTTNRRTDARLIERLARQVDGVVDVRGEVTYRYDDTQAAPPAPPVLPHERYIVPFRP